MQTGAGLRLEVFYYPATFIVALTFFDFLRVGWRLCSCAMHANGKETNEVRRFDVFRALFFITNLYITIDIVYLLSHQYIKSILPHVSQT